MSFFFKDNELSVSWPQLVSDVQEVEIYNPYCTSSSYYEIFKHIIISMLLDKEIILLDYDFSENELTKLIGRSNFDCFNSDISSSSLSDVKDEKYLIERLRNTNENWAINLYTSGTTGLPKKVCHNFNSISRFVRLLKGKSIWGYAYNPTHMAGVQVFLQALLNGDSIVRLFGNSPDEILLKISENNISHISATPTFYRLLLPAHNTYPSVKRITSGGEKFNEKVVSQIKSLFPNTKITNVYASTEAGSLFASENDLFVIKPEFKDLVKIERNELLIHKSLLGKTSLEIDKWYNTGDIVEIHNDEPIKFTFVSRKSEIINVGGYKVNPSEVEETLLLLKEIKEVKVFGKKNSVLGNIVCCEIVKNENSLEEQFVRQFLQKQLQEFKIPRIIRFVEQIETTRTGKIKRN